MNTPKTRVILQLGPNVLTLVSEFFTLCSLLIKIIWVWVVDSQVVKVAVYDIHLADKGEAVSHGRVLFVLGSVIIYTS